MYYILSTCHITGKIERVRYFDSINEAVDALTKMNVMEHQSFSIHTDQAAILYSSLEKKLCQFPAEKLVKHGD